MTADEPFRVRAAIVSERWLKRSINIARAVHAGMWLGSLDEEHLQQANASAYATWDRFKAADYNRSGLKRWEQQAIARHFPPDGSVLIACAGAGREVVALSTLGYAPTGFDPSPELVAIGRRLLEEDGIDAPLILSEPDSVPDGLTGPFGAVVVGWGGYIHIRGRSVRVRFLSQLRSNVEPGAPMLLSLFLRSPVDRHFRVVFSIASTVRRVRRSETVDEIGDSVAATFDHYSTWDEVSAELSEAGFELVESLDAPYPHLVCRAV